MAPRDCPRSKCDGRLCLIGTGQLGGVHRAYWECDTCWYYDHEDDVQPHDQLTLGLP